MKPNDFDHKVISIFKQLRKEKGLKHLYLATCIGVDRSTYSRIENGSLCCTIGQLKILSEKLGVDLFEVLKSADSKTTIEA